MKFLILAMLATALVIAPVPAYAQSIQSMTYQNYKRLTAKQPTLVFVSLNCEIGNYAARLFSQSLYDLRGVQLAVLDAKDAAKILTKRYDLGSIVLLQDGKTLASSDE